MRVVDVHYGRFVYRWLVIDIDIRNNDKRQDYDAGVGCVTAYLRTQAFLLPE